MHSGKDVAIREMKSSQHAHNCHEFNYESERSIGEAVQINYEGSNLSEISQTLSKIHSIECSIARRVEASVKITGTQWSGILIYGVKVDAPTEFYFNGDRRHYIFTISAKGRVAYILGDKRIRGAKQLLMTTPPSGSVQFAALSGGTELINLAVDTEMLDDWGRKLGIKQIQRRTEFYTQPASADISNQWMHAINCLMHMRQINGIPDDIIKATTEHLVRMYLTNGTATNIGHPRADQCSWRQLAEEAMSMILREPMRWRTLGRISHELGCDASALEREIRFSSKKTSAELFVESRMNNLRRELRGNNEESFVKLLHRYNFSISNRFVMDYIRRFGEPPSSTYRKGRNSISGDNAFALCDNKINNFIDSRLARAIRLADLSKFVGLSEHETIVAFKQIFSKTPIQYVIERRLERAKWLLRNTSNSIFEIAIECGFGTQSYLTTAMKKYVGTTPNRIRNFDKGDGRRATLPDQSN